MNLVIDTTRHPTQCSPRTLITCQMGLVTTPLTRGQPPTDFLPLPHIPQCCQATVITLKHIPTCITPTTWVTPPFPPHSRITWVYHPCQHSGQAPPSRPPHTPHPHQPSTAAAPRGPRQGTPSTKLSHLYIRQQIIQIVAMVQIPPHLFHLRPQDHQVSGRGLLHNLLPRPTLKGGTPSILCKVVWRRDWMMPFTFYVTTQENHRWRAWLPRQQQQVGATKTCP